MTKAQEEKVRANLIAFYGGEEGLAKQEASTKRRLEQLRKMVEAGFDLTPSGQSERHRNEESPSELRALIAERERAEESDES